MYLRFILFKSRAATCWCLLFFPVWLSAQLPHRILAEALPETDSVSSKGVVETAGFLRNTEYAGKLVDGETWPGMRLKTALQKELTPQTFLTAGIQIERLAGYTGKITWWPLLRFDYRLAPAWRLVLGTLYGHCRHDLPEPAFSSERFLTRPIEEGLQVLFKKHKFEGEAFLDWQRYITLRDTAQERFLLGIIAKRQSARLRIATHCLLHHRGGQINVTDKKVSSVFNTGAEITYRHQLTDKSELECQMWLLGHRNLTPDAPLLYANGLALLPRLRLTTAKLQADLGYWIAQDYIAPAGEAIFSQISTRIPGYTLDRRRMVFAKVNYVKQINPMLHLLAAFEQYFDVRRIRYDYAFAVYLIYRHDYGLRLSRLLR